MKFNPTPEIRGSAKVTIESFLHHQCKIISIERTRDVEETGKYLLIVRNNDIAQAKTKITKVLSKLQHSAHILSIQDSYTKFNAYPELVNGIRRDPTLTNKAARMKLFLDQIPSQLTQNQPQPTP